MLNQQDPATRTADFAELLGGQLKHHPSSLSERNPLLIGQLCYTHMYEQKLQNR